MSGWFIYDVRIIYTGTCAVVLADRRDIVVIARRNDVAITFSLKPLFESAKTADQLAPTVGEGKATRADDNDCHPFDFAQGRLSSGAQTAPSNH